MNFSNPMWHDFGRAALAMGMGRRFGRGRGRDISIFLGRPGEWPGERRARRGDVKYAILEILAEGPRHGYDVMKELGNRGTGRPSAGSVYPTLQLLEDEGFVTSESVDGKRIYTITDAGRAMLSQKPADEPEDDDAEHEGRHAMRESVFRLGAAVWQVARDGDPAAMTKVRGILDRARREIYALLGGDAE